MTEAMPFLQKYDITFLRPPAICAGRCFCLLSYSAGAKKRAVLSVPQAAERKSSRP